VTNPLRNAFSALAASGQISIAGVGSVTPKKPKPGSGVPERGATGSVGVRVA
jgi:hypothetical protein